MRIEKYLNINTKWKLILLFNLWLNIAFSQPEVNPIIKDTAVVWCAGDPRLPAEFPGGSQALLGYLQRNVINKIKLTQDEALNIRKPFAKMVITEKGEIDSVSIIKSSTINRVDSTFKAALIAMPKWKPAELNGKKIKQYFYIPLRIEIKQ